MDDTIIQINHICDGIYASSVEIARDLDILQKYNIGAIIALNGTPYFEDSHLFDYLLIDAHDDPNFDMDQYFISTYKFILENQKKNKNVLIHCDAGVSRTGAILVHYVMKYFNMNYDDAITMVRTKRKCVHPNIGFEFKLKLVDFLRKKCISAVNNSMAFDTNRLKFCEYNIVFKEGDSDHLQYSDSDNKHNIDDIFYSNIDYLIGVGPGMKLSVQRPELKPELSCTTKYIYLPNNSLGDTISIIGDISKKYNKVVVYGDNHTCSMLELIISHNLLSDETKRHIISSTNLSSTDVEIINKHINGTYKEIIKFDVLNFDLKSLSDCSKTNLMQLLDLLDKTIYDTDKEKLIKKNIINTIEGNLG